MLPPIPVLAILYAAGILLADACVSRQVALPTGFGMAAATLIAVSAVVEAAARRRRTRSPYGSHAVVSSCLLLAAALSLGVWRCQQADRRVAVPWPDGPRTYVATVVSAPHATPRTQRYVMDIAGHRIYAYVAPTDSTAAPLLIGQAVLLRHVTVTPSSTLTAGTPAYYPRYLRMQGIAGTAYVPVRCVAPLTADILAATPPRPLVAASLRRCLAHVRTTVTRHAAATFPADVQGIVEALTMGDKTRLPDTVRHAYVTAGASHLLALSGFHVGIIVLLLTLPGSLVHRRCTPLRYLGTLLMLVALWLFAALAAGTPSIVRAVTMYTLYALALQLGSDRTPLHALMLTAWLMLLVHPHHLFDVGFQLSFAAMLAITLVMPHVPWRVGSMERKSLERGSLEIGFMEPRNTRILRNLELETLEPETLELETLESESASAPSVYQEKPPHTADEPAARAMNRIRRAASRAGERLQRAMSRLLAAVGGLLAVSVVAQMGTAPLVLHTFGQFPTYFWLTNLIAVPLMYAVMALLALWWFLTAATAATAALTTPLAATAADPLAATAADPLMEAASHLVDGAQHMAAQLTAAVARALTAVVRGLNRLLEAIAHLPHSTLTVSHFSWADAAFSWLTLFFLFRFLNKKPRSAVYLLVCVVVWLGWRVISR